ncbi:AI-2E family transporter [Plantactinospora siamensis]|uniref:AI-2E family transporter n=1 Tax=Plantactinospora siamensis TaxID=555372 RepID=A0ABV6P4V3_9ACTN
MPTSDVRLTARRATVVVAVVLAAALLLYLVVQTRQVLTWIIIAAFFAVALHPAVSWIERRLSWCRRWLATLLVYLVVFAALAGLVAVFVTPLIREGGQLADQAPRLIDDIRAGRGPVGHLAARTHVLDYLQSHADTVRGYASRLSTPAVGFITGAATTLAGIITIFVLSFLMVLEAPKIIDGFLALFRPRTAERIRRVGGDCAKTITGYITGNLLISLICGVLTYAVLKIMGVPFAGLIALFVGLVDLIPLVGATLGAVVAVVAGLTHSVTAGIVLIVFFVVYQQLENHLLQPLIFSRTVQLNALTVLIAILVAVELAGILGALLAIPVAGMIQIIARDIWDERRGEFKAEPTVGVDERPARSADAEPRPAGVDVDSGPHAVGAGVKAGPRPVGADADAGPRGPGVGVDDPAAVRPRREEG